MIIRGKCESCVFGTSGLAEECPMCGEMLLHQFGYADSIFITKCVNYVNNAPESVENNTEEEIKADSDEDANLQSRANDDGECEVL